MHPVSDQTVKQLKSTGRWLAHLAGVRCAAGAGAVASAAAAAACCPLCAVMAEFMELLDAPTFKSYGSSLKLVMVADGQAHIYPRRV